MILRFAIASFLVLATTGTQAGDTAADVSWSGFYVGANLGGGSLNSDFESGFGVVDSSSLNADLESLGFHAGYGETFGSAYVGIEANISFFDHSRIRDAGLRGSGASVCSPFGGCMTITNARLEAFDSNLDLSGSLKARLAYPAGRFLPFLTAGIAVGDIETRYIWLEETVRRGGGEPAARSVEGEIVTVTGLDVGYVVGGGAQFALTPRFSVRAEYSFTDLGERSFALAGNRGEASFEMELHELKLGASFHF